MTCSEPTKRNYMRSRNIKAREPRPLKYLLKEKMNLCQEIKFFLDSFIHEEPQVLHTTLREYKYLVYYFFSIDFKNSIFKDILHINNIIFQFSNNL